MTWHDALMHRAAFSGQYGLKKGCLVATRHQCALGSLWVVPELEIRVDVDRFIMTMRTFTTKHVALSCI